MTKLTLSNCAAFLRERDGYLILTHKSPDGDTLGSAAALCSALRRLGMRAVLYPNPQTASHFLPFVEPFFGESGEFETLVTVDIAEEKLFPKGFDARGKAVELAVDHHPSNSGFALRTLLDSDKASCGELVMELIELLLGKPTQKEADLLYIALSTDCGCFQYGNTKAETHRAAARLMDWGANTDRLNRLLFRSSSFSRLRLEGLIFGSLRSYRDNQINLAVVTREMMERSGATEDDCDDLANLPNRVRGCRVAITVREEPDGRAHASLRTDGSVNATEVCARFGGGGHRMASGCTVDCSLEELAQGLLAAVEEALP